MIADYIILALRNIRKRGIRSWLTMLGIFIGIAAVVSLISMGSGLREGITSQFGSLGADKLMIENAATGFGPPGSTAIAKLTDHDLDVIKRVPGVKHAVPRLIRSAKIEFNKEASFDYVADIPGDSVEVQMVYDSVNAEIEKGRLLTNKDSGKVVVGNGLAYDAFDRPIRIGSKILIQDREFEVIGIFKKSSSFILNDIIFLANGDMKEILDIEDEIDVIAVQVMNQDVTSSTATAIEDALRRDRKLKRGEEDFKVQTPQQSLQAINTILTVINVVIAGIAAISLLVGGIGITNTMYTSVLERTKEIGIMKAIGAKNTDILGIFLIESSMLGLAGGIIGAILGISLALIVSLIVRSVFPAINFMVQISPGLLIGAAAFSFMIGTLSGIVPAVQAAKMRPVEALRS